MKDRCILWGAGKIGQSIISTINTIYEIYAFCDNEKLKWGGVIGNIPIISPDELKQLCYEDKIDCIIISVKKEEHINQIRKALLGILPEKIDVLDGIEFINGQQNDYLIKVRNTLQYHWEIDFESQASIWIQNFMSEVKFWIHDVANPEGIFRLDYNNRLFNLEFVKLDGSCASLASMLDENSIVMDIGCGLVSKYGKRLPNSKEIQLLAIDPLAAFYNIINEKYLSGRSSDKCCHFGMFEFMANFFAENYSDAIIINNALDHCIDPYKSIIECLYILKKGGIIHLNHRRAEAVFENYHGLHKWNIDYDNNNNFVIWNNENAVNVSQCLKDIADIKVTHSDDHLVRSEQFVIVDIVKLDDFNLEKFFDIKKDMHYLTSFIENLMDWIAHNVSVS